MISYIVLIFKVSYDHNISSAINKVVFLISFMAKNCGGHNCELIKFFDFQGRMIIHILNISYVIYVYQELSNAHTWCYN